MPIPQHLGSHESGASRMTFGRAIPMPMRLNLYVEPERRDGLTRQSQELLGFMPMRVRIPPPAQCDVSGHRGHLSQDILDRCRLAQRLVVAARIQSELA